MPGAAHGPRPEEDKFIETLTVFALVAGIYASTNFDNLLLLIGWMLSGRLSRQQIFAGYALAAISSEVIDLKPMVGMDGYLRTIPSVAFQNYGAGRSSPVIRGISADLRFNGRFHRASRW